MLIPAILMKDEIEKAFMNYYYSEEMFYYSGCLGNYLPNIYEQPEDGQMQYAIIDKDKKLIGFISYKIDRYTSSAYNFGIISFVKGNLLIGDALSEILNGLLHDEKLHRVEWRMVGGNPVEKHYDKFCKEHNGNKYVLKDCIRDKSGKYHDDIIYEIIND